jgi:hypothetical protein
MTQNKLSAEEKAEIRKVFRYNPTAALSDTEAYEKWSDSNQTLPYITWYRAMLDRDMARTRYIAFGAIAASLVCIGAGIILGSSCQKT